MLKIARQLEDGPSKKSKKRGEGKSEYTRQYSGLLGTFACAYLAGHAGWWVDQNRTACTPSPCPVCTHDVLGQNSAKGRTDEVDGKAHRRRQQGHSVHACHAHCPFSVERVSLSIAKATVP